MDRNILIRLATDENSPEIVQFIFKIWRDEYDFKVKPQDYPDLHHINEHYFNRV